MRKRLLKIVPVGILAVVLGFAIGFNIGRNSSSKSASKNGWEEYFCNIDYVYNLYTGILANNKNLQSGESHKFTYDFNAKEYSVLRDKYKLDEIAGKGTEFERAVNLMDEFGPRLTHNSDYDNHIECNSLKLLEYSLDNPDNGINCLNKSQILSEMCLACGIYTRKVWIYPYNLNDNENHVVVEIYDTNYNKWIMLDMSNDIYFVDKNNMPLSLLEIRKAGAEGTFCTAIKPGYSKSVEDAYKDNIYVNTYIMKDVFFFIYSSYNGFGLSDNSKNYFIIPENFDVQSWYETKYADRLGGESISEEALVEKP